MRPVVVRRGIVPEQTIVHFPGPVSHEIAVGVPDPVGGHFGQAVGDVGVGEDVLPFGLGSETLCCVGCVEGEGDVDCGESGLVVKACAVGVDAEACFDVVVVRAVLVPDHR